MTTTPNVNLNTIDKNDKIWDTINALNENMEIIDATFGDIEAVLSTIVGGV